MDHKQKVYKLSMNEALYLLLDAKKKKQEDLNRGGGAMIQGDMGFSMNDEVINKTW